MKRERFVPTRDYMTFLSRLRLARMEIGISQRDLAKKLGCHHSKINRAEDAKRALDIVETRAWCRAMNLGVVDFTKELDAALNAVESSTDTATNTDSPPIEDATPSTQ